MFRTLCAFLLLASPALGQVIDVYEDTTFTVDDVLPNSHSIRVHGSASLTIDGATIRNSIEVRDSASLEMRSGEFRGVVYMKDDTRFSITGGRIRTSASQVTLVQTSPGSTAMVEILGGEFWDTTYDLRLSEGTSRFVVRENAEGESFTGWVRVLGENAAVELYGASGGHGLFLDRQFAYATSRIDPEHGSLLVDGRVFAPNFTVHSTAERLDGDVNGDGAVDIADLNNVRNFFGQANMLGDTYPLDGVVDLHDLNLVRNNFGAMTNPVPEPSTLLLITLSLTVLAWRGTRRP